MPRRKNITRSASARQRLYSALCAGLVLGALPVTFSSDAPSFLSVAHAQQPDRATQALFLAVDRNDLPGVQAAIDAGANLDAREINGMQPVDLAIERGYFDIAHFLISVRNTREAQGGTAAPTPSPDQLAQTKQDQAKQDQAKQDQQAQGQDQASPPRSTPAPAPTLAPGAPNPFDAPPVANGLPIIGEVREPTAASPEIAAQAPAPAQSPAPATALAEAEAAKKSAANTFVTTFMDFFKPPNTSGIVRKDSPADTTGQDVLTAEELKQELEKIEADIGNTPFKGPAVPISPEELARELPPAPQLPDDMLAPSDASPATSELPPYRVSPTGTATAQQPSTASDDAFGDLQVADVSPADSQPLADSPPAPAQPDIGGPLQDTVNPNLPFGGGVDPDILYLLGMTPNDGAAPTTAPEPSKVAENDPFAAPADPFAAPATAKAADPKPAQTAEADPFAAPADPFAAPADPFATAPKDGPSSVAQVLDTLDQPQEVKQLETHKPKLPDDAPDGETPADPFATSTEPTDPADPFATPPAGEVDELAGLLEGVGEKVAGQDGWDVKKVEGASLPGEMLVLADATPTGSVLDGISLTLGADTAVGQAVGEDRVKMMAEDTIHKPCLQKGGPETVFCVDKVSWPFELEEDFQVDTIMYQGTRAISRYDAGRATYFHSLFKGESFAKVVNYYIGRYGPPSELVQRAIAPLAQPRRDNPTYIWRSREPGTDTITTLEVRQFDDARGGFPDTNRGVVLLYRDHTGSIFPLLSQLELMVLKDSGALDLAPKTPDSVW